MSRLDFSTPAFDQDGTVPERFTCDGADVSPPLSVAGVPEDATSLAVTVDDPDAPGGSFVHWLLWNLPPDLEEVPSDVSPVRKLDDLDGAYQGTNGFGDVGYRGPCPPEGDGEHTYRFTLHALAEPLAAEGGATRREIADDLDAARTASATFTAVYGR
jgi:hypothetical protein